MPAEGNIKTISYTLFLGPFTFKPIPGRFGASKMVSLTTLKTSSCNQGTFMCWVAPLTK